MLDQLNGLLQYMHIAASLCATVLGQLSFNWCKDQGASWATSQLKPSLTGCEMSVRTVRCARSHRMPRVCDVICLMSFYPTTYTLTGTIGDLKHNCHRRFVTSGAIEFTSLFELSFHSNEERVSLAWELQVHHTLFSVLGKAWSKFLINLLINCSSPKLKESI